MGLDSKLINKNNYSVKIDCDRFYNLSNESSYEIMGYDRMSKLLTTGLPLKEVVSLIGNYYSKRNINSPISIQF